MRAASTVEMAVAVDTLGGNRHSIRWLKTRAQFFDGVQGSYRGLRHVKIETFAIPRNLSSSEYHVLQMSELL